MLVKNEKNYFVSEITLNGNFLNVYLNWYDDKLSLVDRLPLSINIAEKIEEYKEIEIEKEKEEYKEIEIDGEKFLKKIVTPYIEKEMVKTGEMIENPNYYNLDLSKLEDFLQDKF